MQRTVITAFSDHGYYDHFSSTSPGAHEPEFLQGLYLEREYGVLGSMPDNFTGEYQMVFQSG